MPRYFMELAYKGTQFSGFQVQENAITIQSSIEQALQVIFKAAIPLTGSSRTDAGVHAMQNFFHFDFDYIITPKNKYNLNAILPADIAITAFYKVEPQQHARFDAVSRHYKYVIYNQKNPFLEQTGYYYPFAVNTQLLQTAAQMVQHNTNFTAFAKRNSQVKTFNCQIMQSQWMFNGPVFEYQVAANRFLRGMVRALVATMLQVGREAITLNDFEALLHNKHNKQANFTAPPQGLFLQQVAYPFNLIPVA